jgi:L,D-transpeptidase YcbB
LVKAAMAIRYSCATWTKLATNVSLALALLAVPALADVVKKKKPTVGKTVIVGLVTSTEPPVQKTRVQFGQKKAASSGTGTISNIQGLGGQGVATTRTEVLAGQNIEPMLAATSSQQLRLAEDRYAEIVASGGWPKVGKAALKKGAEGEAVVALNQRLNSEGYLRAEATQGEFAAAFTTATEDALSRFQKNNGLAVTGRTDGPTLAALNVPASQRLQTIQANIPRLDIYTANLGDRYLVVNIPAQQIEAVSGSRVYSRHNAIVGRPERPTPVVMTALKTVKFNPYWNAPASIIERDIIPRIQAGGTRVIDDMNITVFRGVGGPEIDPSSVDWDNAVADDFHFRQEPGPHNAMATAKIEFDSPFGIYLHDTPEKQLFRAGRRLFSSGCVRVEQVDVLLNWVLNGQAGYNSSRIANLAETLERIDVALIDPPQLRVAYLTAWPVGNTIAFRNDVYDLDRTGFTVGQPLPAGETLAGLRYTLKPVPRLVEQSDGDGAGFFGRAFGKSARGKPKSDTFFGDDADNAGSTIRNDVPTRSVIIGLNAPASPASSGVIKPKAKVKATVTAKVAKPVEQTRTVILGLNGSGSKPKVKVKPKPSEKLAPKADGKKTGKPAVKAKPVDKKAAQSSCKPDSSGKLPVNCAAKPVFKVKSPQTAEN